MKKIILFSIIFAGILFLATGVNAMAPTLQVSATGTGDNVQINVNGDANASVLLFWASQSAILGTINSSGSYNTTVSSSSLGVTSNSSVYVKTGGINGQTSNQVIWPYVQNTTSSTTSTLTLSQTALLLNLGQTSTITSNTNSLYLLSNTTPATANINLNANQITISANTYGTTTANICAVGSTTNCQTVSIVVQNSGASQLNFSQNNFSIYNGQTSSVTVSGGSGVYTISGNSNPSAVTATLNGAVVTLSGQSTTGSASITVCTTNNNNCGIINANSTTLNSTAVSLSQTNPVVPIGQSVAITIFGGTGGNFYVSSNSNPSLVQANITSNTLTLIANASTGTTTISICAYAGSCASLTANVSNVSTTNGQMLLNPSSVSILAGQSTTVTISGGSTPYNYSAPNAVNIFNGNINANTLTIYGVNPGSATANICSSAGCATLSVTINGSTSSTNPPTFSQNNILLNVGQQQIVNISGTSNFYVANNSSPTTASVLINSNSATVTANYSGSTNISICQSGGQCATLYVTVNQISTTPTPVPVPTITPTPTYVFPRYLGFGDKGGDVLKLQQFLKTSGFFPLVPNGYYGEGTKASVKKFQKAHSIRQTGNIGEATKAELNKLQR